MRRILLLALLAAAPLAPAASQFDLAVNDSRTIERPGVTAAWPVDASVVDVSIQNGRIVLFGRSRGTTRVVVVGTAGQSELVVTVAPRPGSSLRTAVPPKRATGGTAELRYSSPAREIQHAVAYTNETKDRRTEVAARVVYTAEPGGTRAETSIPSASWRVFTRGREIALLDRDVDHSALTLSRTPLRGFHYLDDHWRVHAGYTAYTTYQSFLIPVDRQSVAGAGYVFRSGARSTLMPSVFVYGDEGTVASMLYGYQDADRLSLRAELGYSNSIGAAAELTYDSERDRLRADFRYRPDDFAVPAAGNPRGFFGDASWSRTYGRGSTGSVVMSASEAANARVVAVAGDLDHRLNDVVSLTTGASWASFSGARSVTVPAGVRLDFSRGGAGAIYRYSRTARNRGGHGVRLFGRASIGQLYLSGSVDRQQNAPTIDVIFSERPDLALALGELGISATTPADIARALREQAILADLGFIEGVTVDLAPMRTQIGFEAAWLGASESRQQFRLRLLRNVIEGVATRSATTIATLSYARRVTPDTDVFASYSWWRTERRGVESRVQPVAELGLRQRFDELPAIFSPGGGSITGVVFADEDLDGRSDGKGVAAEVELDGGVQTRSTNADGSFAFRGVSRGSHQVVARVPGRPDAYFTTPSRVEAEPGTKVSFGVASSPARVFGTVLNDAGHGIAGVRVLLTRGNAQLSATTTSDGAFAVSAPPGEWSLSITTDSVPAGYALTGIEARPVVLSVAQPLQTAFVLRANRSVSGTGAAPNAKLEARVVPRVAPAGDVELQPSAKSKAEVRTLQADAEGRFSLRSLPAGEVTLVAGGTEHRVVIPNEPGAIALDLTPKSEPAVRTVVAGERRDTMRYVVALGAFRVRANALDAVARARRNGVEAKVEEKGSLTVVRAGPYPTRSQALAVAERMKGLGLEAVVMSGF